MRPSKSWVALGACVFFLGASLSISGCAAGGGTEESVLDPEDAGMDGFGGSGGQGSDDDASVDGGSGGQDGGDDDAGLDGGSDGEAGLADGGDEPEGGGDAEPPKGTLELCVLNEGGPLDLCETPEELDYGVVAAGTQEMRLFRLDNETLEGVTYETVHVDSPDFSVQAVRYIHDPDDPEFGRTEVSLPTTRPAGTALYFEVTFTSKGLAAGPVPADTVYVTATTASNEVIDIEVPIVGEQEACDEGFAACDADPKNGCDTDITSIDNCGSCGTECAYPNATAACEAGVCKLAACNGSFDDCDGNEANGCEANLATDPLHCNQCNNACNLANANAACVGGSCIIASCNAPFLSCDQSTATGCETDVSNNESHCGDCNQKCDYANASESCEGGKCVFGECDSGFESCDGSLVNGCETNIRTDVNHCMGCDQPCSFANAQALCDSGCKLGRCDDDYKDCDLNADNGCEAHLKTNVQHCGACNNDCRGKWANANGTCGAGSCEFAGCKAGFWNLDNDLANGCEYPCNKTSDTDEPDDTFTDANCDGIDGDVNAAIFVAKTGNDANPGTKDRPMATINAALARAYSGGKKQVYVSAGEYVGRVTLQNGISIYGGYSAADGWKRSDSYIVTIRSNSVSGDRMSAIEGSGITAATILDRLTVRTDNATGIGVSNYGLHCSSCSGLWLKNSDIWAGNGSAGVNGAAGATGATGSEGGIGGNGSCDGSTPGAGGTGGTSSCGRNGGKGGKGGDECACRGADGDPGAGGTPGGLGGAGGSTGKDGGKGQDGSAGNPGANGTGGSGGSVSGGFWVGRNGVNGLDGAHGNGGGGGGGGGGQGGWNKNDGAANGGGGGGAGGCGGGAGLAGTAGGGSFGLFLVNSNNPMLTNNTIRSGNGGAGGAGGRGGNGGLGRAGNRGGNACTSEIGAGGAGGSGGNGGSGGHGGGAAGGASFAIYRSGSTVNVAGNNLIPGSGGVGGTSPGNSGAKGAEGNVF